MSTMQADAKVDAARGKVQAWGAAISRGAWDWHPLGHSLQLVHEAMELAPTYQRPWTLLADIYHRIGMTVLAERCLQRSYELATPGPRHPGGFYREVQDHLRTGYPFDERGGLKRQDPPEEFRHKYQRYWSIDEILLSTQPSALPSSVATAFLSYAKEDLSRAQALRSDLVKSGIAVWMDTYDLLPGEAWEQVIRETLASRDFVVCCLSRNSVQKVGFFQAEMKDALRGQERRPLGAVFLVPVRLEECKVPSYLEAIQYVDLFPDWTDGVAKVVGAIRKYAPTRPTPG
jgi:hypothetical protein